MRVLFITGSAAAGGGPRHLLDWLEALHKYSGSEIQIFVAAPASGLFAAALRTIASENVTIPEKAVSIFRLFAVLRFARKNKIDLVHSFGRAGGIYGRFLGMFGYKVLHTPQGLISTRFYQFVYDVLEFALRPLTKRYVFGSQTESDEASDRFGVRNGSIVPPIVSPPGGIQMDALRDRCAEALASGQPLIVGTIGRFVSHKRVLNLARAVLSLGPGFKLRLYGDGDELAPLEKMAQSGSGNIEVRGLVDRWQALSEIDAFVSWSKSESFGLAAAEAMSVGVPCLLSDVPGHTDLAGDSKRAWLFKARAKSDFARAMAEMLGDKSDRLSRIEAAKRAIDAACAPPSVARDLVQIYRAETSLL